MKMKAFPAGDGCNALGKLSGTWIGSVGNPQIRSGRCRVVMRGLKEKGGRYPVVKCVGVWVEEKRERMVMRWMDEEEVNETG